MNTKQSLIYSEECKNKNKKKRLVTLQYDGSLSSFIHSFINIKIYTEYPCDMLATHLVERSSAESPKLKNFVTLKKMKYKAGIS